MLKKLSIILSVMILMAAMLAIQAAAEPPPGPDAGTITVKNNLTGTPDTVTISGVVATDIIRVYSAETGGLPIGATLAADTSATIYISQLGKVADSIYVSVTTAGLTESSRTEVAFDAEDKTDKPDQAIMTIQIQNSVAGVLDSVTVQPLANGDIVRVYPNSVSTVTLGTAVSPSDGATVTVYVNQLGIAKGTVYLTVQGADALESDRIPVNYDSETSAGIADDDVIEVQNRHYEISGGSQVADTDDLVTVPGTAVDEIITIYKSSIGPDKWLPPMEVQASDIDGDGNVTLKIPQLGEKAGKIYVTITRVGKAESKRVTVPYDAEPITDTPLIDNVEVINKYLDPDIVNISNLSEGDIVNIYATPVSLATIGSGTVGVGSTSVSISIKAGDLSVSGGKIYITVTTLHKNESARLIKPYDGEETNKVLPAGQVTVVNLLGSDSVSVSGLNDGDLIKVYATLTSDEPISSEYATAASGAPAGTAIASMMLNPNDLSKKGGNIYVTITTSTANESRPRTTVRYLAEPVSALTNVTAITVTNNYEASDIVTVPGLLDGDTIKVYSASVGDNQIGIGTASGGSANASIIANELSATGGTIYVSVTSSGKNESPRVKVKYGEEATTSRPENIVVTNNYNTDDMIVVSLVPEDATVYIYSAAKGTALLGSGPEAGGAYSLTLPAGKLSASGGKIYVSVKDTLANESPRTAFTYESERSKAPVVDPEDVINNYYRTDVGDVQVPGTEDSVTVRDVGVGDIIRIYKASGGTAMMCSPVTVETAGSVTIPVSQLGTKPGRVYVSITRLNKSESVRTGVAYKSEDTTEAPPTASIVIENNFAAEDNVIIKNLTSGQIVTIYTAATGTTILDTATVTETEKIFTLDNGVLSAGGGKLYVSVKDPDKLESPRTAQAYTSETTVTPKASNILVVNYAGTAYDTVTITGLIPGDIVRIYALPTGGTAHTIATVPTRGATFTLDTNLADIAGTIYVTVTNEGKAESKRIAVKYDAA